MTPGTFIKSTALLNDTLFESAIILITEYNEKGAVGFIVNNPFSRQFNELEEFKNNIPLPLYDGGPVDQEHLFFIHQRPDLITGGQHVAGNIYLGGDFKEAVRLMNNRKITEADIKLFIGYCGWDGEELDSEIKEGSWLIIQDGPIFTSIY